MRGVTLVFLAVGWALPLTTYAETKRGVWGGFTFTSDDNVNQGSEDVRRRYDAQWGADAGYGETYYIENGPTLGLSAGVEGNISRFRGMTRGETWGAARASFGYGVTARAVVAYETWSLHPARDGWSPSLSLSYTKGLYSKHIHESENVVIGNRNAWVRLGLEARAHQSNAKDRLQKDVFDTQAFRGGITLGFAPVLQSGPLRWMNCIWVSYEYELGDYISTSSPHPRVVDAAEASTPDIAFDPAPSTDPFAPPTPPSDSTAYRLDARTHVLSGGVGTDINYWVHASLTVEHYRTQAAPEFEATRTRTMLYLSFNN